MRSVHPAFDTKTRTWFTTEEGLAAEAPSLRELARLLPGVRIEGYVPLEMFHGKQGLGGQPRAVATPSARPRPALPPVPARVREARSRPPETARRRRGPPSDETREKLAAGMARHLAASPRRWETILALLAERDEVTPEAIKTATGRRTAGSIKVMVSEVRRQAGVAILWSGTGWFISDEAKRRLREKVA